MTYPLLFSPTQLHEWIRSGACRVVDCRFDFSDTEKGRRDWLREHVSGAAYAHLDNDLSSAVTERSGRHPLPDMNAFARFLASIGWRPGDLLVAYDDGSNAIASRLWWLMRYVGHSSALLDGGFAAWKEAGLPLESGPVDHASAPVQNLQPDASITASSAEIVEKLDLPGFTVLDARAADRFAGEVEPLDTRAGHIPGSLNRHFGLNLGPGLRFKSPAKLRSEFEAALGDKDPRDVVHSCGSGVTACHNLFAMELAGIGGSRLYPGSWSEWIRDPSRPVEPVD